MPQSNNAVSLENPTHEYLLRNFNKLQLQKHCRDIGITKVWVTKEKLVELIMEKHRSTRPDTSENHPQENQNTEISTSEIMNMITELRERLNIRDVEVDELNELLKAANVMINKLNDRVSSLEDQVKLLQENSSQGTTAAEGSQERLTLSQSAVPKGTLLLGDSNLAAIKTSDLATGCTIRTIRGANTDLINCWVSEKLQWAPNGCVLYCGLQDIYEDIATIDIFDKLGSLITSLKQINDNMQIYICELAPAVNAEKYDDPINNFNNHLINWSVSNGVSVIKSNLKFRLGTGEVDNLCFNTGISEQEENFLNRYGVIRLLDAIKKQCTVFQLSENWDTIIRQTTSIPYFPRNRGDHRSQQQSALISRRGRVDSTSRPTAGRANHRNRFSSRNTTGYDNRDGIWGRNYDDGHLLPYGNNNSDNQEDPNFSTLPTWRRNSRQQNYDHDRRQPRPPSHDMRPADSRRIQPSAWGPVPNRETRPQRPCYNCGETNHSHSECRFQLRVKCNNCNVYGHKTRLCNINTI